MNRQILYLVQRLDVIKTSGITHHTCPVSILHLIWKNNEYAQMSLDMMSETKTSLFDIGKES